MAACVPALVASGPLESQQSAAPDSALWGGASQVSEPQLLSFDSIESIPEVGKNQPFSRTSLCFAQKPRKF